MTQVLVLSSLLPSESCWAASCDCSFNISSWCKDCGNVSHSELNLSRCLNTSSRLILTSDLGENRKINRLSVWVYKKCESNVIIVWVSMADKKDYLYTDFI